MYRKKLRLPFASRSFRRARDDYEVESDFSELTIEGIGQALHYGDLTGQQPVLALISAYYNISGAEQEKLEYVSGLCAAHGVEVWALTTRRE